MIEPESPAGLETLLESPAIDGVTVMTMAGRTLMVLGGAYLLRALTESGVWPSWLGVGAGFAYAALWLAATERAAGAGRWMSAGCTAQPRDDRAAAVVGSGRRGFHLVGAVTASVSLTAITIAALAVAIGAGCNRSRGSR